MSIQIPTSNPFLKQLYDTMLDKAILDCQVAISTGNANALMIADRKLVMMIREKEQRAKLDAFIHETEKQIRLQECQYGYTLADRYVAWLQRDQYKMDRGFELFDKALGVLDELGYLKKNSKTIQSNMPGGNQLFDVKA